MNKAKPVFVVHKHAASRLHYDFRLEADGVLKSWAIPKGPSVDPSQKRLAVSVPDHELEYGSFEGVIPEGQYGAGVVIVWDTGTYENIKIENGKKLSMEESIVRGRVEILLHGKKLKGGFALVRFAGQRKNWLLIKMDDEFARSDYDVLIKQPESVTSGKTVEQLQ